MITMTINSGAPRATGRQIKKVTCMALSRLTDWRIGRLRCTHQYFLFRPTSEVSRVSWRAHGMRSFAGPA
jgi:hypothetical protein